MVAGGARPERVSIAVLITTAFTATGEWGCSIRTGAHERKGARACEGVKIPSTKPGNDGQVAGAVNAGVEPMARSSSARMS